MESFKAGKGPGHSPLDSSSVILKALVIRTFFIVPFDLNDEENVIQSPSTHWGRPSASHTQTPGVYSSHFSGWTVNFQPLYNSGIVMRVHQDSPWGGN
jgi:hypothetical protein